MATIDLTKRDQVPIRSSITGDEEITTVVGTSLYVMNIQTILDAASPSVSWGDVTGKPSEFPPEAHTHPTSQVIGLDTTLSLKANTADLGALAFKDDVDVSDIVATGTPSGTTVLYGDGKWATAGDMLKADNLSGLSDPNVARTNIGLGNVNNTSDANKPVSTATQTALNLKADLAGPTFTGVPSAPTAAGGTNTTQIATTAFVTAAVAGVGGGDLLAANNLSDLSNVATARTNLGLGTLATASKVSNADWSGTQLSISNGGTGAQTASAARGNLGLGTLATLSNINNSNWSGTALAVSNGGTGGTSDSVARANLGVPGLTSNNVFTGNATWQTGTLLSGNNTSVSGGGYGFPLLQVTGASGARAACGFYMQAATDPYIFFHLSGTGPVGSVTGNGTTGVVYATTSDYRLKTIDGPMEGAVSLINSIKIHLGRWNSKLASDAEPMVLAHELQDVAPYSVVGEKDAVSIEKKYDEDGNPTGEEFEVPRYQMADYSKLVPLLIAAVQELSNKVDALTDEVYLSGDGNK